MLRTSFAITVPAHRPTRLGSNILLALGTMTLAQVMAPAAAQAQCNSSSNPSPPSPVVANFSNQSFGNNPPLVPYNVASLGLVGCNGANGGSGESGSPGSPGQPGGQISSTNSGLTIIGGFAQVDRKPIALVRQSSAWVVMADRAVRVATSIITISLAAMAAPVALAAI